MTRLSDLPENPSVDQSIAALVGEAGALAASVVAMGERIDALVAAGSAGVPQELADDVTSLKEKVHLLNRHIWNED